MVSRPIVILGDCLEALKQMDGEIFDLVLLDPPYFDYKTGHRKDRKGKLSQSLVQQSRSDQLEVVRECIKKLKPGRAFFFFTNWENIFWFQEPFQSFLRNMIVWDKGNWSAGDLKGSFGVRHEIIFLGTKGEGWTYTGKRENDIWAKDEDYNLNRVGNDRIHATEKPVDLYRKIIENSTGVGDLVFDPYVGSGASAIAARNTGRNYLGYEIDKEYYQGILKRLQG